MAAVVFPSEADYYRCCIGAHGNCSKVWVEIKKDPWNNVKWLCGLAETCVAWGYVSQ